MPLNHRPEKVLALSMGATRACKERMARASGLDWAARLVSPPPMLAHEEPPREDIHEPLGAHPIRLEPAPARWPSDQTGQGRLHSSAMKGGPAGSLRYGPGNVPRCHSNLLVLRRHCRKSKPPSYATNIFATKSCSIIANNSACFLTFTEVTTASNICVKL